MIVYTPISVGELLDKITILEIKEQRIQQPDKHLNICNELRCLREVASRLPLEKEPDYQELRAELLRVNGELWDLEDRIRELMERPTSDTEFIDTAVAIHRTNDGRAFLKRVINSLYKSDLIEEKSYKGH